MSFETLVAQLGLPFLFIGAGTEGEAVAVAGGALAHRGMLPLWEVGLAVLGGSLVQGQILFLVGRYLRGMAWVQRASSGPAYARVIRGLLDNGGALAICNRRVGIHATHDGADLDQSRAGFRERFVHLTHKIG
ncbi:hypothetical protein [Brevundimonas sp.]|uniref:hypothetical protein n=1 Tax=Brevundimonas sp. TaxID=1871086 RepID=UPI00356A6F84